MHKPIRIEDISLEFPGKLCFERFTTQIHDGDRIAIIGRNGTGKSMLLKMLNGMVPPSEGEIIKEKDIVIGYVPQTVQQYNDLSGGERFNKALTTALAMNPDVLLLDEPTNHLDKRNRKSLMQMLKHYYGTLIMVSHDVELLNSASEILWRIDEGQINVFTGKFSDYITELNRYRSSMENELELLGKEKKAAHKALMKEQQRAKNSKDHGLKAVKEARWAPIIAGGKKRQAQNTAGRLKQNISDKRESVNEQLRSIRLPEIILPKFSLDAADVEQGTIVMVTDASVGYGDNVILKDINFSLTGTERMGIVGDNASGKTTLIKAMLSNPAVTKTGNWDIPALKDIGYLDQHYSNLDPSKTVIESLKEVLPDHTHSDLRDFLNDFLFRKNEEVNASVKILSGGEKARLSLALIAAKTPKLLILDEITNNVDMETKDHIIEVLKEYPAAIMAISHEQDFLDKILIDKYFYTTKDR